MTVATEKKILSRACKEGYSVCAFSFFDITTLKAIIDGAEESGHPVIVKADRKSIEYIGLGYISCAIDNIIRKAKIPIAIQLDHSIDKDHIKDCIKAGFTSIMFDASERRLDDNIKLTRDIVSLVKDKKVSVEGEVAKLAVISAFISTADPSMFITDKDDAKRFEKETGIDCMAISAGASHGAYKGKPDISLERIKEIKEISKVPLAMHGCDSLTDEDLIYASRKGISKMDFSAGIEKAYTDAIKETLSMKPDTRKIKILNEPAYYAVKDYVKRKMMVLHDGMI